MQLMSFLHAGRASFGLVVDNQVIDLSSRTNEFGSSLKDLLGRGHMDTLRSMNLSSLAHIPLSAVTFAPVIPDPSKILCIGINYASHIKETGRETPAYPMIFTRFPDSQVGHAQAIVRPSVSVKLDFEGELAVIMGRPAYRVKASEALAYVAGYSCYNEGSVRDWQKHTIQFTPGKNFPNTGGFGPWLTTVDEIPDPAALHLTTDRVPGSGVRV